MRAETPMFAKVAIVYMWFYKVTRTPVCEDFDVFDANKMKVTKTARGMFVCCRSKHI